MAEELYAKIQKAIVDLDKESLNKLTEEAIATKVDPAEAIEKAYTVGIQRVGKLFEVGDYFLPELIHGAQIVKEAVSKIEKLIPRDRVIRKGKLVIGEPYLITEPVPEEYRKKIEPIHTEIELLKIAREEGFDIEYMVRANNDDWDRYEASNWYSLSRWIEENQNHQELQQVVDWYHEIQDDYLKYGREYCGWAVYILNPIKY